MMEESADITPGRDTSCVNEDDKLKTSSDLMGRGQRDREKNNNNKNDMSYCANCGKEGNSDDMNTCNKCKSVKYRNAACKKKHRKKHKKACERRVVELQDEALFADPPPREDCPICFIPLPHATKTTWTNCCGKVICDGCMISVEGDKCAFCRIVNETTHAEDIVRTKRRMELNDPEAFVTMGCHYHEGFLDLIPQNYEKSRELWSKAAELGSPGGHRNLAARYYNGEGVERDLKKAIYHWEKAAMGGHHMCRHDLGVQEEKKGNLTTRGIRHYIIAAKQGFDPSMYQVERGFENGYVSEEVFLSTLSAYQQSLDEVKSPQRDEAERARAREAEMYATINPILQQYLRDT